MKNNIIKICLLLLLFYLTHSGTIYKVPLEEFKKLINSENKSQSEYKAIIENIKSVFSVYPFLDINKNPPQPDKFPSYHNKYDFYSELDKISTTPPNFYSFYRDLLNAVSKLNDGHVSIQSFNSKFDNYGYFEPIIFKVDGKSNPVRLMALPSLKKEIMDFYFGKGIYESILNCYNKGLYVREINGKNPFMFLRSGKFSDSRHNKNSKYVKFFDRIGKGTYFKYYPYDENYLKKFKIVFSDGTIIETELAVFV